MQGILEALRKQCLFSFHKGLCAAAMLDIGGGCTIESLPNSSRGAARRIPYESLFMTSVNDLRSSFVDYFASNGHEAVASSPLVPRNDPTLMFTNSGMV